MPDMRTQIGCRFSIKITRSRGLLAALLGALFCTAGIQLYAQFPIRLGSVGQEYGKAMCVDHDTNVIVALLFQNTIDFDPGNGVSTLGNPPGIDLALVKYDRQGNHVWSRNISGITSAPSSSAVCTPHGVTVDASNNVYCIGYYGVTSSNAACVVDFDPGTGTAYQTNSGGWDPFIAKYDANGNYLWARTLRSITNSPTDERAWDLAVDADGSVYVTGFINGTFDLDAGTGSNLWSSAGEKDLFLVKYDANGNHVWGFVLNDTGDSSNSLKETSVALDNLGHVFLMGHFNGTMDVDPGAGVSNLVSAGGSDMFIARYSTNGVFERAIRLGGTQSEVAPPGTLRTDPAGNLYLTARFHGVVDLDPGPGLKTVTNLSTADNIWVASYDNALSYRWAFAIASDGGLDGGHRVAFDTKTNVYVTGWFAGTADFDGGPGVFNLASGNTNGASDIFLAKYDRSGSFLWARAFGGSTTNGQEQSIAAGLAVDQENRAYITGQYYGTNVQFQPSRQENGLPDSLGQNDCFVIKFDENGNVFDYKQSVSLQIKVQPVMPLLSWNGAGTLQSTTNLAGPWTDLPEATSPHTASNAPAFYRLRR